MSIVINAELRDDMGKGASRRLRRAKKLPAIVYGAGKAPVNLTLEQKDIQKGLENEAFYSQVLELNVAGKKEDVLLRDLQHHPARQDILHIDFQRVQQDTEVHVQVPLHFIGEETAPGVKTEGGAVSHVMTEVEVGCLPKDIPEFIEIDISGMHLNDVFHLSDIKLPAGVEILALSHGEEYDSAVVSIHRKGAGTEAVEEGEAEAPEEEPEVIKEKSKEQPKDEE